MSYYLVYGYNSLPFNFWFMIFCPICGRLSLRPTHLVKIDLQKMRVQYG